MTLYGLIFILIGDAGVHWLFALLAAGAGAVIGWSLGVRTASGGAIAGILAGIWIFFELVIAGAAIALAALLSVFG